MKTPWYKRLFGWLGKKFQWPDRKHKEEKKKND